MCRLLLAALAAAAAAGVAANVNPGGIALEDDLIITTGLQPEVVQPGGLSTSQLSSNTNGEPPPFRFLFLNNITGQPPNVESFIINTLMPAAGRALARSVRVRPRMFFHHA